MAEYWKSTPKYWCKFCEVYVRDTGIERKNHEATGRHQGAIQRSLRTLHNGKAREEREQQRAKDEVARLNKLVGGAGASRLADQQSGARPSVSSRSANVSRPILDPAAQRKAHAEQLIALGVELPDTLKEEVTGKGEWQVVSQRVINLDEAGSMKPVQIKQGLNAQSVKSKDALTTGVHKRKAENDDDDDTLDEQSRSPRPAWGSSLKRHQHDYGGDSGQEDLDSLLSGITKKPLTEIKQAVPDTAATERGADDIEDEVKGERDDAAADELQIKLESGEAAITAPPVVVFRKRKGKR